MNTVTRLRSATNTALIGFTLGVLVAVPAVLAAASSGGAGHGKYVAARALFPAPMLLTLLEGDRVGALSIAVGLLQFPIYGTILGWSIGRKNYLRVVVLTAVHVIAASVCFIGTLPNFS